MDTPENEKQRESAARTIFHSDVAITFTYISRNNIVWLEEIAMSPPGLWDDSDNQPDDPEQQDLDNYKENLCQN